MSQQGDGWSSYEKQVMYRLGELDRKLEALDQKMHDRIGTVGGRILTLQADVDRRIEALDDRMDVRIGNVQTLVNDIRSAEIGEIRTEIALLKLKAGVWGALAGMVPAAVLVLYQIVSGQA